MLLETFCQSHALCRCPKGPLRLGFKYGTTVTEMILQIRSVGPLAKGGHLDLKDSLAVFLPSSMYVDGRVLDSG